MSDGGGVEEKRIQIQWLISEEDNLQMKNRIRPKSKYNKYQNHALHIDITSLKSKLKIIKNK